MKTRELRQVDIIAPAACLLLRFAYSWTGLSTCPEQVCLARLEDDLEKGEAALTILLEEWRLNNLPILSLQSRP
ncbi:MAG: hypothetical protein JXB07_17030 [Anaerolineae bacterium]|nr:hypothetical protein [Anaerolineae bacterium]